MGKKPDAWLCTSPGGISTEAVVKEDERRTLALAGWDCRPLVLAEDMASLQAQLDRTINHLRTMTAMYMTTCVLAGGHEVFETFGQERMQQAMIICGNVNLLGAQVAQIDTPLAAYEASIALRPVTAEEFAAVNGAKPGVRQ